MVKFFKDNSKIIIKLLVNRFGAIVFSLMCVVLVAKSEGNAGYIALSCVSIIFYCYLVYLAVWECGASARIRVDGGRIEPCPNLGFKIGLAAGAPGIVFAVLLTISAILSAIGVPFAANIESVLDGIMIIWHAMYNGIVSSLIPAAAENPGLADTLCTLYYFVALVPEVLVTWGAYKLGYNGKFMSIAYKNPSKE